MTEAFGDALLRYGHTRSQLAALDAKIQALDPDGHLSGAALLDDRALGELADLFAEQARASSKFSAAAEAVAAVLKEDD